MYVRACNRGHGCAYVYVCVRVCKSYYPTCHKQTNKEVLEQIREYSKQEDLLGKTYEHHDVSFGK